MSSAMNRISKTMREPLLQFLFIGAAIYLLYGMFSEPAMEESDNVLTVSAGEIEWLQTTWRKRWNRLPTEEELDGLIQQYVKETVLYREALAMGLDKDDTIIRRRLAQKLEFLVQDLVAFTPPSEEELQTWFDEHRQRYQQPVRFTFTQVFIDPDKHGDATLDEAEKIKAALMAQGGALDKATVPGDSFMLQHYYPASMQADIQKLFGSGFAKSLLDLAPGQWHGPIQSGYGVHLVYVHSISEPPPPLLSEVRECVLRDWEDAKRKSLNEQFYTRLRDRYTIVIEKQKGDDKYAALQDSPQ